MRKIVSPILSAAILGGALILCSPSQAAPASTHAHQQPTTFQMPTKITCVKILNIYSIC